MAEVPVGRIVQWGGGNAHCAQGSLYAGHASGHSIPRQVYVTHMPGKSPFRGVRLVGDVRHPDQRGLLSTGRAKQLRAQGQPAGPSNYVHMQDISQSVGVARRGLSHPASATLQPGATPRVWTKGSRANSPDARSLPWVAGPGEDVKRLGFTHRFPSLDQYETPTAFAEPPEVG